MGGNSICSARGVRARPFVAEFRDGRCWLEYGLKRLEMTGYQRVLLGECPHTEQIAALNACNFHAASALSASVIPKSIAIDLAVETPAHARLESSVNVLSA